jgi:hypothetical protein
MKVQNEPVPNTEYYVKLTITNEVPGWYYRREKCPCKKYPVVTECAMADEGWGSV